MARTALTVHPGDNVVTLLDFKVDERITRDGLALTAPVPFGHKAARRAIEQDGPVIKYGVVIGVATQPIQVGEHVHVHNCR